MRDRGTIDRTQDRVDVRGPSLQRGRPRIQLRDRAQLGVGVAEVGAGGEHDVAASAPWRAPREPDRGRRRDRQRAPPQGRQQRPRQRVQRARRGQHELAVSEPRRHRRHQQVVEHPRGPSCALTQRRGLRRPPAHAAEPRQREPQPLVLGVHRCGGAERVSRQSPLREHQRGQLAVKLDQLHQRALAERPDERRSRRRSVSPAASSPAAWCERRRIVASSRRWRASSAGSASPARSASQARADFPQLAAAVAQLR